MDNLPEAYAKAIIEVLQRYTISLLHTIDKDTLSSSVATDDLSDVTRIIARLIDCTDPAEVLRLSRCHLVNVAWNYYLDHHEDDLPVFTKTVIESILHGS